MICFCIIFGVYIDDGYSGTDFSRPGVQKLLEDAQSGRINLIICKDLSRFGRNYIGVGRYIDYIFPSFNIRFIALSDNVDTLDRNRSQNSSTRMVFLSPQIIAISLKARKIPL